MNFLKKPTYFSKFKTMSEKATIPKGKMNFGKKPQEIHIQEESYLEKRLPEIC